MITSDLSPVFNHLWQSTLVAGVAGILALLLRRNRAHTRHWLWLIASVKFLIPFLLLVAIGSRVDWSNRPAIAPAGFSTVIEEFGQPFAQAQPRVVAAASMHVSHPDFLPAFLAAVWLIGFAGVLLRWYVKWNRVRSAMRAGSLLPLEISVPVLSTPSVLEPGVFGVWRPLLMLPEGITEHLAPAQLSAILRHELCHVRRRDNLAAAIHMVVEAIFWFHPLVWWLGARLVEERERACDEEVLRMGSEPATYAESILKVCQFYLGFPLACMSGVTGADLKQRIVRIMTHRVVHKLDFGRKLLLCAAGLGAVAGPVAFGLSQSQDKPATQSQPSSTERLTFDAASIKPAKPGNMGSQIRDQPGGRFTATNMSLKTLMTLAFNVQPFQIVGSPSWLESDRYDIEAKPESGADEEAGKPMSDMRADMRKRMEEQRPRLQSLLEDRCKLTFHRETKEVPVYALVVAKGGPKIKQSQIETTAPGPNRRMMMGFGQLIGTAAPLSVLTEMLSRQLGRVVLDRTGLNGNYDFDLKWTPDTSQMSAMGGPPMGPGPGGPGGREMPPPPDPNGPTVFTAIQEQLGLKLESQKGPVEVIVIDHVEKPSEN
jgi:uncharacterized protein (TIGR03435 family)